MNSISNWLCTNSNKNLFVKIVHPGGHVELHDRPVLAADLLNRNPKCCVAHPTVFHHPHAAVLSPETTLVLGNKYYVVPLGTIRKLRLKHNNNSNKNNSSVLGDKNHNRRNYSNIGKKNEEGDDELSDCNWLFSCGKNNKNNNGAKEKSGKNSDRCIISDESKMRRGRKKAGNNKEYSSCAVSSSSSSPPGRLSLASLDNWHPGLESINEEY